MAGSFAALDFFSHDAERLQFRTDHVHFTCRIRICALPSVGFDPMRILISGPQIRSFRSEHTCFLFLYVDIDGVSRTFRRHVPSGESVFCLKGLWQSS